MNFVRFQKPDYMFNMDRMLNSMINDLPVSTCSCGSIFPLVNISEDEKQYSLEFYAPGFEKESFEVKNNDGVLSVKGKLENSNEDSKKFIRKEYAFKGFEKSYNLPDNVDVENIVARYKNGILIVELPKKTVEMSKKSFDVTVM